MINNSGIGRYIQGLLKGFKNSNFKIYLILNKNFLTGNEWLNNFEIIHSDVKIYSIKEQIVLPFLIPKCDLFFSPHFNIPFFKIRAKKRVATIHDVYHLAFAKDFSFLERWYAKFFIKQTLKKSSKVITVSNFSKIEILKYFKKYEEKLNVIHNGVDLNFFNFIEDEILINKTSDKLNLPGKYFLFVGNLKKHKNLQNVIRSFEILEKEFNDINLVIVGNNKNMNNPIDIEKFLLKDKILWLENISDNELKVIYQKSIALVFPSFYEGFGYPAIEAFAMKTTAIVSNFASLPEICGNGAIYVNPFDISNIYEVMKKILTDENIKKILLAASDVKLKNFNIEKCIDKHLNLFEEILNES
ncbi:MAG: hypothetical protein A2888_01400 [Chlamydiae bacterium RIFCSPLOWO2_01_FULL_28_7]|nr:MAG: hypothetical protein A2888_01400 [Chlamydiae bacterium RIFCSPLOWO2_01_FULL_28_7]